MGVKNEADRRVGDMHEMRPSPRLCPDALRDRDYGAAGGPTPKEIKIV